MKCSVKFFLKKVCLFYHYNRCNQIIFQEISTQFMQVLQAAKSKSDGYSFETVSETGVW